MKSSWLKKSSFLLIVVLFGIWNVFPVYWMMKTALVAEPVADTFKQLIPEHISLSPFRRVLFEYPFMRWLLNGLIVSGLSTITAVFCGCLSGYSLARYKYRTISFFGTILYFTQILPHVVLLVPVFILFDRLGLRNSLTGLVLVNILFSTPVCTWLLKGFFDSSPVDIEEAALIDGCSRFRSIFSITMRMNRAGIFATSLFVFLDSWYEWLFAATLIDRKENWTISASIFVFIGEVSVDWKLMMAAGVLATIPTMLLFGVLQGTMLRTGTRLGRY